MAEVIIKSPSEMFVDGVLVGAVFDAIANRPDIPIPDIQRGFEAYHLDLILDRDSHKGTADDRVATVESEAAAAILASAAEKDAAEAEKLVAAEKLRILVESVKDAKDLAEVAAAVADAEQSEIAKKIAILEAQKAEIQAEIDRLTP